MFGFRFLRCRALGFRVAGFKVSGFRATGIRVKGDEKVAKRMLASKAKSVKTAVRRTAKRAVGQAAKAVGWRRRPLSRRLSVRTGLILLALLALLATLGGWFVHHPRQWLDDTEASWPRWVTAPLLWAGEPTGDLTDALGWTGHDAVYEYDEEAPAGSVLFAGAPRRTGAPAPNDIVVLDRGEFKVGWSPKLRHPVWCAYHVVRESRFPTSRRSFARDRDASGSPAATAYERSGYDRGHMVPNHAIVTRYGEEAQRRTFLMSNIAPQSPSLNRGVWRNVEHRIADLWTARYGEVWVIVGCVSATSRHETLHGTDIDVPTQFYQIVVAQEGMNVRAFALLFEQDVPYGAYPTRYLVTIDRLEEMTGLDFLPDLPSFIQAPLEAELPTRLWPVRFGDVFSLIALRFFSHS